MKVLVVGSGGREHAIISKISMSKHVDKIYCTPGNGGIEELAECVNIDAMDIKHIVEFAKENNIDLVVVSPDDPLAAGMVDELEKNQIKAFGPLKSAAIIESSKAFAKQLMKKYNIPTAKYEIFENADRAIEYLKHQKFPQVIKADGLALGKGVVIAYDLDTAIETVKNMIERGLYKEAGRKIVIEEFLKGTEVSILTFTDGKTIIPMVSSKDNKRAYDNDEGPNTGGMGAFSPNPYYTEDIAEFCMKNIFIPTIRAMEEEHRVFKGVLYFGLMLTEEGPKVVEYNARFGDPETQVVLPRLKTDIIDIFNAVIEQKLHEINIEWNENACSCIVLASSGYPGKYEKGYEIKGIDIAEKLDGVKVFHAGTKREGEKCISNGGRVLGVSALGSTLEDSIKRAYEAVSCIKFENMFYRKDIGKKI